MTVKRAISNTDIVLTDSLSSKVKVDFAPYQITKALMQKANAGALLNPCPPFQEVRKFQRTQLTANIL
jgi:Ornithine carbamoyltransferase